MSETPPKKGPSSNTETRPKRFSERFFALPFGRYEASHEANPPANEVLIGREGQRAYFVDLLLRMGRRGAYLITGRRGIGKTVFVKACLNDYRQEVFERFLASNVGRVTFWDRIGVAIMATLIIGTFLMVSDLANLLTVQLIPSGYGQPSSQLWPVLEHLLGCLVAIPLGIICLYPLLYARNIVDEVLQALWQDESRERLPSFFASGLILLLACLIWWLGPSGAPALSVARAFSSFGLVLLVVPYIQKIIEFFRQKYPKPAASGGQVKNLRSRIEVVVPLCFVLVALSSGYLSGWIVGESKLVADEDSIVSVVGAHLLLGLALTGLAFLLRGLGLRVQRRRAMDKDPEHEGSRVYLRASTPRWYILPAIGSALGSGLLWIHWSLPLPSFLRLLLPLLIVLVSLALTWFGEGGQGAQTKTSLRQPLGPPHCFNPAVALFGAKAFFCVLIALQLVHPLVTRALPISVGEDHPDAEQSVSSLRPPVPLRNLALPQVVWKRPRTRYSVAGCETQRCTRRFLAWSNRGR